LGHVQSGKTASFTAVIAKAADVGYRFIIVLSGLNNVLRYQTQLRIDEDLIAANLEHWITVTNIEDDFASNTNVNSFLTEKHSTKVLGVVKKNSGRLKRLHKWLTGAGRRCFAHARADYRRRSRSGKPQLTQKPDERTKINELIVKLLADLPKAAYVGYTATPFANLFIDPSLPEDLYPRDFIVDLPRGKGYFGAEQIFGRAPLDETEDPIDGLNVIRLIPERGCPTEAAESRCAVHVHPRYYTARSNAVFLDGRGCAPRAQRTRYMPLCSFTPLNMRSCIGMQKALLMPSKAACSSRLLMVMQLWLAKFRNTVATRAGSVSFARTRFRAGHVQRFDGAHGRCRQVDRVQGRKRQ
jgi:hypothetical protein